MRAPVTRFLVKAHGARHEVTVCVRVRQHVANLVMPTVSQLALATCLWCDKGDTMKAAVAGAVIVLPRLSRGLALEPPRKSASRMQSALVACSGALRASPRPSALRSAQSFTWSRTGLRVRVSPACNLSLIAGQAGPNGLLSERVLGVCMTVEPCSSSMRRGCSAEHRTRWLGEWDRNLGGVRVFVTCAIYAGPTCSCDWAQGELALGRYDEAVKVMWSGGVCCLRAVLICSSQLW